MLVGRPDIREMIDLERSDVAGDELFAEIGATQWSGDEQGEARGERQAREGAPPVLPAPRHELPNRSFAHPALRCL